MAKYRHVGSSRVDYFQKEKKPDMTLEEAIGALFGLFIFFMALSVISAIAG